MPLGNGQLSIVQISTYRSPSGVGWGGSGISGANNMNYYTGKRYYTQPTSPSGALFPNSNLAITAFYNTSPVDEWNCACVCDCACACGK